MKNGEVFADFITKTEAFNKVLSIESLATNRKNFTEALKIMKSMTNYVIDHKNTIPRMKFEALSPAQNSIERLVNNMEKMIDNPNLAQYANEYRVLLDGDLKRAYYILIPEGRPKN